MISKTKVMSALLLLAVLLAVHTGALADTLTVGAKGEQVLALQTKLSDLEYYTAKITAKYDSYTKKSVALFQACNGLDPTGKADDATWSILESKNALSYSDYIQNEADEQCLPGQKGSYVKSVQKRLKTYGYYSGSANGLYGDKTVTAVALFQKANGLSETGIADRETRSLLAGKSAVQYKTYIAQNNLSNLSSASKDKTQILFYQQQLVALGYLTQTTGKYDSATIKATKYFQAANSLPVTGKAGYDTRALLNSVFPSGIEPSALADTANLVTYDAYKQQMLYTVSKSGSSGLQVELLQSALCDMGYLKKSGITAKFSSTTKSAVTTFQSFNNITMTGTANAETLTLLHSGSAYTFAQVKGSDSLKKGMVSAAVKKMQQRLKELKFYSGDCNGKYGDKTVTAVKAFQKSIGYTPTGIAYSTTLAKLSELAPDSEIVTNTDNEKIEKVIDIAQSKLGFPYGHDDGPKVFDCCGFVRYCYKQGAGITLAWTVKGQATYSKGEKIDKLADCKRGDILIFENDKTGSSYDKYSHSALYMGNGVIIHASSSQGKVVETNIKEGYSANYYQRHFIVGVRILE